MNRWTFFTNLGSNIIFNEIDYFTYLNLLLVSLLFWMIIFFLILSSSLLLYSTLYFHDTFIEFFLSVFSLFFLWLIISPSLILLLDFDNLIIPSLILYTVGHQWYWNFSLDFLLLGFVFDQTLQVSTDLPFTSFELYFNSLYLNWYSQSVNSAIDYSSILYYPFLVLIESSNLYSQFLLSYPSFALDLYIFEMNSFLVIPLISSTKIIVYSFDVIHSLGFYSFGIKIDAIPSRINLASILRNLFKGEHRGFCFELCGEKHSSMMSLALILFVEFFN